MFTHIFFYNRPFFSLDESFTIKSAYDVIFLSDISRIYPFKSNVVSLLISTFSFKVISLVRIKSPTVLKYPFLYLFHLDSSYHLHRFFNHQINILSMLIWNWFCCVFIKYNFVFIWVNVYFYNIINNIIVDYIFFC